MERKQGNRLNSGRKDKPEYLMRRQTVAEYVKEMSTEGERREAVMKIPTAPQLKVMETCIQEKLENIMNYGTAQEKLEDLHTLHIQIIGLCDTFHQFTTAEVERLREPVITRMKEIDSPELHKKWKQRGSNP